MSTRNTKNFQQPRVTSPSPIRAASSPTFSQTPSLYGLPKFYTQTKQAELQFSFTVQSLDFYTLADWKAKNILPTTAVMQNPNLIGFQVIVMFFF